MKQGKFRGVPFLVDVVESDFGQRVAKHEFPGRNTPYTEPLGRKGQGFTVEAFVLGSDVDAQRDALINACEKPGPGELIHPTQGTKQVVCEGLKVRESRRESRIVTLAMTFSEAGKILFPQASPNLLSSMLGAANDVLDAAGENFENNFGVSSSASFVLTEAETLVTDLGTAMQTLTDPIKSRTQSIADYAWRIRNLKADVTDLVQTPGNLVSRFQDAMGMLTDLLPGSNRAEIRKAYESFFTFGNDYEALPETTADRLKQKANQDAVRDLVRQTAIARAAVETAKELFASVEDAQAVRDTIIDALDDQLDSVTDDNLFNTLQELAARVNLTVPPEGQELPRLKEYQVPPVSNTLIVTYDLYESLDLESDVIARNRIRHPGLLSGKTLLKVLTR